LRLYITISVPVINPSARRRNEVADPADNVPEFARNLVTRGLDALAQKLSETGDAPPGAVAKLANMWTALSEEERQQVGAGIVAAATAAAMAIPATVAAVKRRTRAKKSQAAAESRAGKSKDKKNKKKRKKKEKKKR
jgi:hypothetical protein